MRLWQRPAFAVSSKWIGPMFYLHHLYRQTRCVLSLLFRDNDASGVWALRPEHSDLRGSVPILLSASANPS